MRRAERKNRDTFRKMMEEHIAAGTLTARTHWGDYCQRVNLFALFLIKHIHISSSRNDYSFISVLIYVYLLYILLLLSVYAYDTNTGQGF